MTRREFAGAMAGAAFAAQAHGAMGFSPDSFVVRRPARTVLEFLEFARGLGGGGVQATLASHEPEYLRRVRARIEEWGMYFELLAPLPKEDGAEAFEAAVRAAKEAGAESVRSVCLSGRRYETFATLEEWRAFVADSRARLARARRIVEKHRLPLGVENHKDWTAEEMVPLMREFGGEYLGACIDFGNNVALLDDPVETAELLAPYVINTHIKDMGVEEYADGFLLSEVALGEGYVDLKRIVAVLRKARPRVRFSLDMLTRNPLAIPCLTEKYWVTFPERNGKYLARTMAAVRRHKRAAPLARIESLGQEERLRVELDNVAKSVAYARDVLGLLT